MESESVEPPSPPSPVEKKEKKVYMKMLDYEKMSFTFVKTYGTAVCHDVRKAFGMSWTSFLDGEKEETGMTLTIKCNDGGLSNVWELWCNVEAELRGPENSELISIEHKFGYGNNQIRIPDAFKWVNPMSKVHLEVRLKLKNMIGLPRKNSFDFENKYNLINDAIVEAKDADGETKFLHVSKAVLSLYSPVFYQMFLKLESSENDAKIVLEESYKSIHTLLELIYPSHCFPKDWYNEDVFENEEVGEILKMAQKYKIDFVTKQCEEFLISAKYIELVWKLHYAETYNLDQLMEAVLGEISWVDTACLAVKNHEEDIELSNKTKAAVFERLLSLPLKNYTTIDNRNSDGSEGSDGDSFI